MSLREQQTSEIGFAMLYKDEPKSAQTEPYLEPGEGVTLTEGIRHWLERVLAAIPVTVAINCWGEDSICTPGVDGNAKCDLNITIKHPGVIKALILSGDPLALVDAYLDGQVDFDGKIEDVVAFAEKLSSMEFSFSQKLIAYCQALVLPNIEIGTNELAAHEDLTVHSRKQDKTAIEHHYDVGNDFYSLWLDPLLVYSAAYFTDNELSLAKAQELKLDSICRKLQLKPQDRLLDIGCGWGGLVRWAAEHYDVCCTGITLSEEQLTYNQQWINKLGLADKIQVRIMDYRDLPESETFDKVVSIGMIEHVGPANYPVYFDRALSLLKPGGLFLNSGITTYQSQPNFAGQFTSRYIFPNGELTTLSETLVPAEKSGFEIIDVENMRIHYAKTLRHWAANLERAQDRAAQLVGASRVKLWLLYLTGSAAGFESGKLGLFQILMRRRHDEHWSLPMTRTGWLD